MSLRLCLFVMLAASVAAVAQDGSPSAPPPAPSSSSDVEVFSISTPDHSVTAHFMGQKFASNLEIPFGVHALEFTFAGDPATYKFQTDGEIAFTNWNTHVFSPSGDWAVLLKGQHGPFVVVSTKKLKDYLKGSARPEKTLSVGDFPNAPERTHQRDYQFLQWTSYDGFLFAAICCGQELQYDYQIPQKELKLSQTLPQQ